MPKEKTWSEQFDKFYSGLIEKTEEGLVCDGEKIKSFIETLLKEELGKKKQEILDKLPKELNEIEKRVSKEIYAYDDGFNNCLEEIINLIKSL